MYSIQIAWVAKKNILVTFFFLPQYIHTSSLEKFPLYSVAQTNFSLNTYSIEYKNPDCLDLQQNIVAKLL